MDPSLTPPAGLTTEQLTEWMNENLGKVVNNMLSARLNTEFSKFEKKIGGSIGDTLKAQLPELLKGLAPAVQEPGEGGGGKKAKDVELDSLRRQMSEMQSQLQEQRDIAAREQQKNRTAQLEKLVTERLNDMGKIAGTGAKLALLALTAAGRVGYGEGDDADKAVFRGDDGVTVDLDTGLKQWLKTDEARFFQAPSATRGSGSRPGAPAPSGPVTHERAQSNAMGYLAKALQSEFRGVDVVDTE